MSKKVTFTVDNMNCGSCVKKINTTLEPFQSETKSQVTLENKTIEVEFSPEKFKAMSFKKLIEEAGFKISKMDITDL